MIGPPWPGGLIARHAEAEPPRLVSPAVRGARLFSRDETAMWTMQPRAAGSGGESDFENAIPSREKLIERKSCHERTPERQPCSAGCGGGRYRRSMRADLGPLLGSP